MLADARELVAALPFGRKGGERALEVMPLGAVFGEGEGFLAGLFEEFLVAQGIGDVEAEVAGLTGAEKFAWAAKQEIRFGDFEAVCRAYHRVESGAGFLGHAHVRDEDLEYIGAEPLHDALFFLARHASVEQAEL